MFDTSYDLDAEDRIRAVDEGWRRFAIENDAPVLANSVLGTSVWDWVSGVTVRRRYRVLFARVRDERRTLRVDFRCDSPELRRFMELRVSPLPDRALHCATRILAVETRDPVPLPDPSRAGKGEKIQICSSCLRFLRPPDSWLDYELASGLVMFYETPQPPVEHTFCADCQRKLDDA